MLGTLRQRIEARIRIEERVQSDDTLSTFSWDSSDLTSSEAIEQQVDRILAAE